MRNRWIPCYGLVSIIALAALSVGLFSEKVRRYIDAGGYGTYGSGYADLSYYSEALAERQPAEIQKDLKGIFDQLVGSSDADLFVLKSSDDPCLLNDLIFCRAIPSEKVKPFIEAAFAYKQVAQARDMSLKNNLISVGSLCMSFLGLIIAGLSFAYRKKSS